MALKIVFLLLAAFLGRAAGSTIATLSRSDSNSKEADQGFKSYIAEHGRSYQLGTEEYEMRKGLYQQRLAAVGAHNAVPDRLWTAALSKFSDHTEMELKALLGYRKHARPGGSASLLERRDSDSDETIELPKNANWLNLTKAYKVRDQGACGSCWASTTSSVLEAHYEIYKTKDAADRSFSTQQIVDCTPNPRACGGTGGCDGATVELGMDWIVKNGLATDKEVPYHARNGRCTANKKQVLVRTNGGLSFGLMSYKTLPQNKDLPLAQAVAKLGPVGISASAGPWFMYSKGIFDGCSKNSVIDHAITLYGYGEDKGKKYWLIRNSWGSNWGEKGFIRLLRTGEDHCGTDYNNQEGTGCKGDPTSVTVCGMCGMLWDSVVPLFKNSPGRGGLAETTATGRGPTFMRREPH